MVHSFIYLRYRSQSSFFQLLRGQNGTNFDLILEQQVFFSVHPLGIVSRLEAMAFISTFSTIQGSFLGLDDKFMDG